MKYQIASIFGPAVLGALSLLSVAGCDFTEPPTIKPPRVVSTTPPNDAKGVPIDSIFTVKFSKELKFASVNNANVQLKGVAAEVRYSCSTAYVYPKVNLSVDTCYTATVKGVEDSAGNSIAGTYTGNFCTGTDLPGKVKVIAAGAQISMAIMQDGTLWAWGYNGAGQFGDGTRISRTAPARIGSDTSWSAISLGDYHTVALKSDGTLWTWGTNMSGQLGDGTKIDRFIPAQVGSATNWSAVAAGDEGTIALKSDGTLWAWGRNGGQLGDGTTINKYAPVQLGSETKWSAIAKSTTHSVALKTDGTLWAWGNNYFGQLGDGTTTDRSAPAQIGSDTNWVAIAAGSEQTFALKTNGTLWSWGFNQQGQLGDGTTIDKNAPVQIGSATNWSTIAAGGAHSVALKTDGTLWAWGYNAFGQLGDGTTADSTTPVQMGSAIIWGAIAAGGSHTLALGPNGSLWGWGSNVDYQVGAFPTRPNTPVQVVISPARVASAPTGVVATPNKDKLTISWENAPGATSYEIQWSNSYLQSRAIGEKKLCVTSPYTLDHLEAGVTYSIVVLASHGNDDFTPSHEITVTMPSSSSGSTNGNGTGETIGGSGGYYWANADCGSSSQCAQLMGGVTTSFGPICTLDDCNAWRNSQMTGAKCETTAKYTKHGGGFANGTCAKSGVDF